MSSFSSWVPAGSERVTVGLAFFGLFFGFLGRVDFGSIIGADKIRELIGSWVGRFWLFVWTRLLLVRELIAGLLLKVNGLFGNKLGLWDSVTGWAVMTARSEFVADRELMLDKGVVMLSAVLKVVGDSWAKRARRD
jgi:hypothetical protein